MWPKEAAGLVPGYEPVKLIRGLRVAQRSRLSTLLPSLLTSFLTLEIIESSFSANKLESTAVWRMKSNEP